MPDDERPKHAESGARSTSSATRAGRARAGTASATRSRRAPATASTRRTSTASSPAASSCPSTCARRPIPTARSPAARRRARSSSPSKTASSSTPPPASSSRPTRCPTIRGCSIGSSRIPMKRNRRAGADASRSCTRPERSRRRPRSSSGSPASRSTAASPASAGAPPSCARRFARSWSSSLWLDAEERHDVERLLDGAARARALPASRAAAVGAVADVAPAPSVAPLSDQVSSAYSSQSSQAWTRNRRA